MGFFLVPTTPVFSFYSIGCVMGGLFIALYAPNVMQIYGKYNHKIALIDAYAKIDQEDLGLMKWRPSKYYATVYTFSFNLDQ